MMKPRPSGTEASQRVGHSGSREPELKFGPSGSKDKLLFPAYLVVPLPKGAEFFVSFCIFHPKSNKSNFLWTLPLSLVCALRISLWKSLHWIFHWIFHVYQIHWLAVLVCVGLRVFLGLLSLNETWESQTNQDFWSS